MKNIHDGRGLRAWKGWEGWGMGSTLGALVVYQWLPSCAEPCTQHELELVGGDRAHCFSHYSTCWSRSASDGSAEYQNYYFWNIDIDLTVKSPQWNWKGNNVDFTRERLRRVKNDNRTPRYFEEFLRLSAHVKYLWYCNPRANWVITVP